MLQIWKKTWEHWIVFWVMLAVADTSPLRYLIMIGQEHILPELFTRVAIPAAVCRELEQSHPLVKEWLQRSPEWLEIRTANTPIQDWHLDAGETEAIALALELNCTLLIDEREGRHVAERMGVACVGLLGIIVRGALAGLIDFEKTIHDLRATNFYFTDALVDAARRRLDSK